MQAVWAKQRQAARLAQLAPPPQQAAVDDNGPQVGVCVGFRSGVCTPSTAGGGEGCTGFGGASTLAPRHPPVITRSHLPPCARGALWARLRELLRSLHIWLRVSHDMGHRLRASNVGRMGSDHPASGSEHGIPRVEMIIKQQGCVIKNKSNQITSVVAFCGQVS